MRRNTRRIRALVTLMAARASVADTAFVEVINIYNGDCNSTPVTMYLSEVSDCTGKGCATISVADQTLHYSSGCTEQDRHEYVQDEFYGVDYVMYDMFGDENCDSGSYVRSFALAGLGYCVPYTIAGFNSSTNTTSVKTTLDASGSAEIVYYSDEACSAVESTVQLTHERISNHSCMDGVRYYTRLNSGAASESSSESTSANKEAGMGNGSTGSISGSAYDLAPETSSKTKDVDSSTVAAITLGCLGAVLAVGTIIVRREQTSMSTGQQSDDEDLRTPKDDNDKYLDHLSPGSTLKASTLSLTDVRATRLIARSGLWDDEAIIAVRIPREKVVIQHPISRGGYGEVYKGTFNSQPVAIKMLHPETRKNLDSVNEFLAEMKMVASMDHPHIVQFMGVAWDSLADLCVVLEYMEGGDLRALLTRYERERQPEGFNCDKIKIALHVAHALTYLHSLDPPVIHRDLKSRNILLTPKLDAKVTDFGIARAHSDKTMTNGVGSSLWMAPEVMMARHYDTKADVFSFGVVLSELDSHEAPYSHVKCKSSGKKLPDAAILQLVAIGELSVQFSEAGQVALANLGAACVSFDPRNRPTAAEALATLQQILAREVL